MKSSILWSLNIQVLKMKYKCLQGTQFLFFFKFANIDSKLEQVQLRINLIVISYVIDITPPWDSIK
jgi:hypothetical protein